MPATQKTEVPAFVKDLAQATSVQATAANRFWLALMGFALFVLPRLLNTAGTGNVDLPWNIGNVPWSYFYLSSLMILSVLVIAFCSAFALMVRAHNLVHDALDKLEIDEDALASSGGLHPRDVLDALRLSSFTRVAPLPQLARGGFFHDSPPSKGKIWFAAGYFLVLKVLANGVYLLFPGVALVLTAWTFERTTVQNVLMPAWGTWAARIFVIAACCVLVHTMLIEYKQIRRSLRAMTRPPKTQAPPRDTTAM